MPQQPSPRPELPPLRDSHSTLNQIKARIAAFNDARDWGQYHSPRNLAMATAVEAGELLALFLWSKDEGPQPPISSRQASVQEEAADVAICLLNFCQQSGIDLASAIEKKLARNAVSYPEDLVRGRMEKYNEYHHPGPGARKSPDTSASDPEVSSPE